MWALRLTPAVWLTTRRESVFRGFCTTINLDQCLPFYHWEYVVNSTRGIRVSGTSDRSVEFFLISVYSLTILISICRPRCEHTSGGKLLVKVTVIVRHAHSIPSLWSWPKRTSSVVAMSDGGIVSDEWAIIEHTPRYSNYNICVQYTDPKCLHRPRCGSELLVECEESAITVMTVQIAWDAPISQIGVHDLEVVVSTTV
jgi:hypothetical protein